MQQAMVTIEVSATGQGLVEFTNRVESWLAEQRIRNGSLTLFCRHTSASLLIQENAAPAARRDLERYFARLAPENAGYEHDEEGPDDMPAHLRAALTSTQLVVPVLDSKLMLGRWQGIYLFEHRRQPTPRQIVLHLLGD